MPVPLVQPVLQLRITLEEVHAPAGRRVLVPGSVRLDRLHRMFQTAMGWEDRHLHSFEVGDALFGMRLDDYPDDVLDEKSVTVASAVGEQRRFAYEYDFGDSWRHEVVEAAAGALTVALKGQDGDLRLAHLGELTDLLEAGQADRAS